MKHDKNRTQHVFAQVQNPDVSKCFRRNVVCCHKWQTITFGHKPPQTESTTGKYLHLRKHPVRHIKRKTQIFSEARTPESIESFCPKKAFTQRSRNGSFNFSKNFWNFVVKNACGEICSPDLRTSKRRYHS
ncbi:unnamed protein product [Ixodes pacificus]